MKTKEVIDKRINRTILFVANTSWSIYNFRRGIITILKQEGFKIVVAAPEDAYSEKIIGLGIEFAPLSHLKAKEYNPFKDYFLYRELAAIYKMYKPALIFHYTIKPNIYGTLAAGRLKIPSIAVITGLGYVFVNRNIISLIAKYLYRKSLASATEVWFLNHDDRQTFIKGRIVPAEKSALLPGEGINTEYFQPSRNVGNQDGKPLRFILLARMIYDKGIQEFVEASRLLKEKGYQFESLLLGFLDVLNPKAISKDQMDSWTRSGFVKYLGATEDVKPYIEMSDCVVLPSYREGIPRTLLEGASMNKAIITTNSVGCKDTVEDGVTGYLCKAKDPADLASKMETFMLLSTEQQKKMGQRGRQKVKGTFDEKIIIDIYKRKLSAVLQIPID